MSCGALVVPTHSSGCRAQNSTHPGGGCVTVETKTWAGRSGPATAGGGVVALAASAAIKTVPDFTLKTLQLKVALIHSTPDVTSPPTFHRHPSNGVICKR